MEGRDREIKQVRRECVGRGWGGESVCGRGGANETRAMEVARRRWHADGRSRAVAGTREVGVVGSKAV